MIEWLALMWEGPLSDEQERALLAFDDLHDPDREDSFDIEQDGRNLARLMASGFDTHGRDWRDGRNGGIGGARLTP